jgi:hypothetical protein
VIHPPFTFFNFIFQEQFLQYYMSEYSVLSVKYTKPLLMSIYSNFTKTPGLTFQTYNKNKNSINRTLQKLFCDNFVKFKDISFPGDFDKDLVHYSPSGMKKYFFRIRRILLGFKCILDFHFLFSVCMQETFIIHFTWDEYLYTLPWYHTTYITQIYIYVCLGIQCDKNMVGR